MLSRAIRFLWFDYDDRYFWFEMVELVQKLVLTNFLLFVNFEKDGSNKLLRLFIGLLIAIFGLTVQLSAQPFRRRTDDAIASVVRLMLVLFFILGIMVKLCDVEGANTVHSLLDAQIDPSNFCFTLVGVSTAEAVAWLIIIAGLLVVLVPLGMFVRALAFSQSIPILRDAKTMEPPILLLGTDKRYHLFLSHVWSTGQDQCAVIKRQLQLLLPGVVIFLDVDDLQDIGDLEGYVRATGVMLFFLSKQYFTSRNCLREVKASLDAQRPLVLVHEQQEEKGGGPLAALRAECREEVRSYVFDGHTPITWHRISHYQNLTLKLIATEMLRHGPKYRDALQDSLTRHSSRESTSSAINDASPQEALSLVLPGEVNLGELALPRPLVLWCSAANPGAAAIAQELADALASGGHAIRVVERKPNALLLDAQGESVAMLLYLNKDTWAAQPSALEHDVRNTYSSAHGLGAGLVRMGSNMREVGSGGSGGSASGADKIKIVLVHENDPSKGGCEFGTFFATTPQGLIEEGIYKEIAIALHTPPHRDVSLALVAQGLGATKDAARQAARRGSANRRSSSSASASSSARGGGGSADEVEVRAL